MRKSHNLLDISEVCQYFGLSESTVRRKVRDSREGLGSFPLPLFRSKSRALWRKCDIEEWRGEDAEIISFSASPMAPVQTQSLAETRKQLEMEFGIVLPQTAHESSN